MATGIRAFDKVYRDFIYAYDMIKSNVITHDENLYYFSNGNGKDILYTFKKTIDNFDSVNRALEFEGKKDSMWWQKFINYLAGKVKDGHKSFWSLRTNAALIYDKFYSNIVSADQNVIFFRSGDGRQTMYMFKILIGDLDAALRELEIQAYKDRPWWTKLSDFLWAKVPY